MKYHVDDGGILCQDNKPVTPGEACVELNRVYDDNCNVGYFKMLEITSEVRKIPSIRINRLINILAKVQRDRPDDAIWCAIDEMNQSINLYMEYDGKMVSIGQLLFT